MTLTEEEILRQMGMTMELTDATLFVTPENLKVCMDTLQESLGVSPTRLNVPLDVYFKSIRDNLKEIRALGLSVHVIGWGEVLDSNTSLEVDS